MPIVVSWGEEEEVILACSWLRKGMDSAGSSNSLVFTLYHVSLDDLLGILAGNLHFLSQDMKRTKQQKQSKTNKTKIIPLVAAAPYQVVWPRGGVFCRFVHFMSFFDFVFPFLPFHLQPVEIKRVPRLFANSSRGGRGEIENGSRKRKILRPMRGNALLR
jgi:hypothetical protein